MDVLSTSIEQFIMSSLEIMQNFSNNLSVSMALICVSLVMLVNECSLFIMGVPAAAATNCVLRLMIE